MMLTLSDGQLLMLYQWWSEEMYCASFMGPTPSIVGAFLSDIEKSDAIVPDEDEQEFLDEVHRQLEEVK